MPDARYSSAFEDDRIKTQDGDTYILRYDDIRDEWTLGAYTRAHLRASGGEESGTLHS